MKSTETFSPGDLVIWRAGSTWSAYDVWGKVTRVTPKGTVYAKPVGSELASEREFRGGKGLRRPTEREIAHRDWWQRRPRGEFAHVSSGLGHDERPTGARVDDGRIDSPEKIQQAAKELLAIRSEELRV